jgi:hypothetical protein
LRHLDLTMADVWACRVCEIVLTRAFMIVIWELITTLLSYFQFEWNSPSSHF